MEVMSNLLQLMFQLMGLQTDLTASYGDLECMALEIHRQNNMLQALAVQMERLLSARTPKHEHRLLCGQSVAGASTRGQPSLQSARATFRMSSGSETAVGQRPPHKSPSSSSAVS